MSLPLFTVVVLHPWSGRLSPSPFQRGSSYDGAVTLLHFVLKPVVTGSPNPRRILPKILQSLENMLLVGGPLSYLLPQLPSNYVEAIHY